VEQADPRRLRVPGRRQADVRRDDVLGAEPQVHGKEALEAAGHQAGAREESDGDRDLGDDQDAPGAAGISRPQRAHGPPDGRGQVRPRRAQRGGEAEQQPAEDREQRREAEHARVQPDLFRGHRVRDEQAGTAEVQPAQQPHAAPRHGHADSAAEQGEESALRQELAHQARAARAQRRADGHFPPPRRRAREQQVGHVRARDQQHGEHGAQQHEERRPALRHHLLPERNDVERQAAPEAGLLLGERARDGRDIPPRLLERQTVAQAGRDAEVADAAGVHARARAGAGRVLAERQPHVWRTPRAAEVERRRQHADHRISSSTSRSAAVLCNSARSPRRQRASRRIPALLVDRGNTSAQLTRVRWNRRPRNARYVASSTCSTAVRKRLQLARSTSNCFRPSFVSS
jgi:hypothetical protein